MMESWLVGAWVGPQVVGLGGCAPTVRLESVGLQSAAGAQRCSHQPSRHHQHQQHQHHHHSNSRRLGEFSVPQNSGVNSLHLCSAPAPHARDAGHRVSFSFCFSCDRCCSWCLPLFILPCVLASNSSSSPSPGACCEVHFSTAVFNHCCFPLLFPVVFSSSVSPRCFPTLPMSAPSINSSFNSSVKSSVNFFVNPPVRGCRKRLAPLLP